MRIEGSETGWADAPELDGIGEGRAPVKVLLLHGWPVSERVWVSQVSALRDAGFDPIAPHLYGRGPSIDDWAAQLLREIDGPLVPVGASMGGYCALALARRAPERIVGMALVGSRADADSFERRRLRQEQIVELRAGEVPDLADEDANLEHLAVAQEAMRDRLDLTGVAASFGGPLLVCVGDRDGIVSVDEARELADGALDGRLEVFPGAGHFVAVDQPERVQRRPPRLPEPVEDVTLAELRDRLGDEDLTVRRRPDAARVLGCRGRPLRSAPGSHPRGGERPARAHPRVPQRGRGARGRRHPRGSRGRRLLPRR